MIEFAAKARWQRWHEIEGDCYIVSFWDDPTLDYLQGEVHKRYVHGTYVAQGLSVIKPQADLVWFMNWEAT